MSKLNSPTDAPTSASTSAGFTVFNLDTNEREAPPTENLMQFDESDAAFVEVVQYVRTHAAVFRPRVRCEGRQRAPRAAGTRRRGSKRSTASSRAGPDSEPAEPEPPSRPRGRR